MNYRCLFPGVLYFLSACISAAVINTADRDIIERKQRELLEQAQHQREDLQKSTKITISQPEKMPTEDNICHRVRDIVFQNADHLSWSVKARLKKPLQGSCLTLTDINKLVHDTTNSYVQRGYITSRAWLPEQNIADGMLIISVDEGRVEDITLDGENTLALQMAFPNISGSVLNLRDIEQGMDQLNRLPSQQVTIDILPGKQPGYSSVRLRRTQQRLPATFMLSADNDGQKSTGTGQINANITLDNLLRLAEQWSFSASRDSGYRHDRRSRRINGGVSIPYGYWLFSYQMAWSDFYQHIPVQDTRYRYQGEVTTQRLGLNRVLLRDGQQKMALDLGLSRRRTDNKLAGQRLKNSSVTLTSLTTGINYSRALGGGYLTFNPSISHGLRYFGATEDEEDSPYSPRSQFRKLALSASYFYPLTPSLYYLTSAYGQTSADNLYESERISVGGQYSVRGFKQQYLNGNRGAYWRNELNWRFEPLPIVGDISLIGAIDGGWLHNENHLVDGGTILGTAIGLAMNNREFSQSFTIGKPLVYPASLQPDNWVTWWQASITL